MTTWGIDERLANDCAIIGDFPLCRVLLMLDARFPWIILVPRRIGLSELHDLSIADRSALMDEVLKTSAALQQLTQADKINIASLGNIVSQLHLHVVARFASDELWPGPVWGLGEKQPYASGDRDRLIENLRKALAV
ncbi:MAG: HIT domain-containing protein [Parvularculaceae bacterium]|nr:HIT domain-containing protein [Parvularculaceae bacterium]